MSTVREERDRAENQRLAIEKSATANEAILHAFDGIATLLLDVLREVREIRGDQER